MLRRPRCSVGHAVLEVWGVGLVLVRLSAACPRPGSSRCLAPRHSSCWRPCALLCLKPGMYAALGSEHVAQSPDVRFCWQGAYTT
jgi:hypothetical protein